MADCTKIKNNLESIQAQLKPECKLVVVSKYRAFDEIQCAYDAGYRTFAENRVQALLDRKTQLPDDIEWHLIGHLQRNKVKYIAPFIEMIHSVDSFKLLREINNQAAKHNRVIPCLIQMHIAQEESKFGLSPEAMSAFFKNEAWHNLHHIQISGLMAMATLTDDTALIEKEFKQAQQLFLDTKALYSDRLKQFTELSIGMSSDYVLAQKYGSTMVRVGSAVFK